MKRQQLIVLVVEHDTTHATIIAEINAAVKQLPHVSRVGGMVKDSQSGTVFQESDGSIHPLLLGGE